MSSLVARRRLSALLSQLVPAPIAAAAAPPGAPGVESLRVEPLPGKTFGACVRGLSLEKDDLSQVAQKLNELLVEHALLIFEGQEDLTMEKQIEFAARFGKLEYERLELSNKRKTSYATNGRPAEGLIKPGTGQFTFILATQSWHMDSTFFPVSAKYGLLYAEEVPSGGGETEWCDMRAAFHALDQAAQERLEGLTAYHSAQYSNSRRTGFFPPGEGNTGRHGPGPKEFPVEHGSSYKRPLLKTHPVTGRKVIISPAHAFNVSGLTPEESEKLLDDLVAFAVSAPERTYGHPYKVGDLVIWDNRSLQHRSRPYDYTTARVMRSSRVGGDPETETALPADDGPLQLDAALTRLKGFPKSFWDEDVRDARLR